MDLLSHKMKEKSRTRKYWMLMTNLTTNMKKIKKNTRKMNKHSLWPNKSSIRTLVNRESKGFLMLMILIGIMSSLGGVETK